MAKFQTLLGDGAGLSGTQVGGNQRLKGKAREDNNIIGDAQTLREDAAGGDDRLFGRDGEAGTSTYGVVYNALSGDGFELRDRALGGRDKLFGGDNGRGNDLNGDAVTMRDDARGGNDTLVGGDVDDIPGLFHIQFLRGDAQTMFGKARGGDDLILLGNGFVDQQIAYGDAGEMRDAVRCGNDTLIGGVGNQVNVMYGDAGTVLSGATTKVRFGDDVLISGGGTADRMWGDSGSTTSVEGGADTFVFQVGNGLDRIFDFEQARDVIDLTAFAAVDIHGIEDLTLIAGVGAVTIEFGPTDRIQVDGVTALTAADFLFA